MSEVGQKATSARQLGKSAPPPGTDIVVTGSFAPEAALGGLEIQLPLYPQKQTQLGNRGMSEKCQKETRALQQISASFEQVSAT